MATIEVRMEVFLARGRKLVEELAAELDALEAVAHGDETPGQRANRLVKLWGDKWQAAHRGQVYIIGNRAKAIAGFLRLIKAGLPDDDIAGRIEAYLKSTDRFYADARHSLELFLGAVNKFKCTATSAEDDADFLTAPVADCRHRPACASDQEHTRRRSAEMRT